MTLHEFAAELKTAIVEIQSQGQQSISCHGLVAHLNSVLSSPEHAAPHGEIERLKAFLQAEVETQKAMHLGNLEMFRSVITYAQTAIRSSMILNGGAAVALLAFIAHLATVNSDKVVLFAGCLLWFAVGALLIGLTAALAYLSQWFYHRYSAASLRTGGLLNIACIVLGLASYGTFAWGLFSTHEAFTSFADQTVVQAAEDRS